VAAFGTSMIWLIGNRGMLGTELSLLLEKSNIPFIGTDREQDITNPVTLKNFGRTKSINWIINCAAYTAVDKAEDDRDTCRLINVEGPQNIAVIANEIGAKLIHISTDYVFNGCGNQPYKEDDVTDPIGVYGITKRDGEKPVIEENKKSYIIRTARLYGKYGNNFVKTMLKLMNERDEVKVVNDQTGNPTWAFDLSQIVISFIRPVNEGKNIPYGVYHFTNEGEITWFDFAKEIYRIARELGLVTNECQVTPCATSEYPTKAKRPVYSALDKTKIKNALDITIPSWDESLRKYLEHYDDS
jgi:dTDP-4-dehydrorhamnose reductase